ncbi:hypothetical protein JCM30394_33710 [Deferrisoma palaeochoriense]
MKGKGRVGARCGSGVHAAIRAEVQRTTLPWFGGVPLGSVPEPAGEGIVAFVAGVA